MVETPDYTAVSRQFIEKADEALAEGDLLQASEKAWGAVAQQVKAVAENRGWQHDGHRPLFRAVNMLASETGDARINSLFHAANSLHSNFYEGWMEGEQVASGIEEVKELLALLEPHTN